ncbi:polysaccharide deacetylase family protein [Caldimonas brevitalea]|uniref:Polysaccharide deacetylase n=1 Tax=Caldimonas brevitalea TaxID=413882 RepID=A0A0G3BMF7_9BURK|nr:polysaccharide deacetylase family protein [Caldimonas brevitalea]AKJ30624.1 polysaccharide deacetylase [Caldimonas brevitalea]
MKPPMVGQPPVSVLMYHQVGMFPRPKAHRAAFCDVKRFAAQMAFLKWGGYSVISLEQAYRGLFEGAPLPARPVVLTFDDGYQNFKEHAWPVLQRHGFPASVFIVTEQSGRHAGWLAADFTPAPLMDHATLRQLAREGVNFGSHTLNHRRLSQLDETQQRREIFDSKAALEDVLGQPVPDFCYPYGDYDPRARDLTAEAGYRLGLTCIRGAANTADNAFEIPRKAISYGDNVIGYAWKLHMKHARKDKPAAHADVYA